MRIPGPLALVLLPVAALAAGACSLALTSDPEQCNVDADCAARGFGDAVCEAKVCVARALPDAGADADAGSSDPKWGCIGNVAWGAQDPSVTVLLRTRIITALAELPIKDMAASACARLDAECTSPLDTAKSDANGYIEMHVPKNFAGYLRLEPAQGDTTFPSLLYALPPQSEDADPTATIPAALSVHLMRQGEFDALLAQIGATADPELGHLFGLASDCTGEPTAKVSLHVGTIDKETIAYYSDSNGLPSVTATSTGPNGEGGWVNLPTGVASVTAFSNPAGKQMGTYSAQIRKGFITYLPLPPSP